MQDMQRRLFLPGRRTVFSATRCGSGLTWKAKVEEMLFRMVILVKILVKILVF